MSSRENSLSSCASLSIPSASTQDSSSTPMQSPIEHFISDMLSAVTEDNILCGSCELNNPAFSKCVECNETLCETCVGAHQRVRLTKDHKICRISSLNGSPQPSGSSESPPLTINTIISPCNTTISPCNYNLCRLHQRPQRLYCRTCIAPVCNNCYDEHHGHAVAYIEEGLDEAKDMSLKLSNDTRAATLQIRAALDNVQRMSEKVEIKAFTTATEVRNVMRKYIAAFEARELELLRRIDQGRNIKLRLLNAQMEDLRRVYTALAKASDIHSECAQSANPYQLMIANQKVSEKLRQAKSLEVTLMPCQTDDFKFVPPNETSLSAINNMGTLNLSSTAFSLPFCKEPQLYLPSAARQELRINSSKCRPIYGSRYIVVKNMGPRPSQIFGSEGERDGQVCRPWGVCCNRFGQFIVADRSNNRIQIFDPSGKFLFKFGSQGTSPGQFDRPAGVAVNPQDDIIIADKDNHRIQVFRKDGSHILSFGEKGTQIGQFQYPWDVACDSMGNILVSDTRNHRIQMFNWNGAFITKYGFEGPSNMWKHFDSPRGVSFHPSGDVVVTDFNNHRLVIIDPALTRARYIGEEGSDVGQFNRPQGVACDDRGNIIVADSRNNRIQVFNDQGEFLWSVGQLGNGSGDLDRPSGICLTEEGRIAVVDFGNNRVQIF